MTTMIAELRRAPIRRVRLLMGQPMALSLLVPPRAPTSVNQSGYGQIASCSKIGPDFDGRPA
jgi:hypothetical protein